MLMDFLVENVYVFFVCVILLVENNYWIMMRVVDFEILLLESLIKMVWKENSGNMFWFRDGGNMFWFRDGVVLWVFVFY